MWRNVELLCLLLWVLVMGVLLNMMVVVKYSVFLLVKLVILRFFSVMWFCLVMVFMGSFEIDWVVICF